ncbi:unnamed protein product [Effrenium voratum]|uniref:Uncharacterized protein n=1 Tax=Effrenium voratum TaxID=2562239 RepID=A0AA36JJ88_9DINO|nr:unnamed protein product [Effrenium voratum]
MVAMRAGLLLAAVCLVAAQDCEDSTLLQKNLKHVELAKHKKLVPAFMAMAGLQIAQMTLSATTQAVEKAATAVGEQLKTVEVGQVEKVESALGTLFGAMQTELEAGVGQVKDGLGMQGGMEDAVNQLEASMGTATDVISTLKSSCTSQSAAGSCAAASAEMSKDLPAAFKEFLQTASDDLSNIVFPWEKDTVTSYSTSEMPKTVGMVEGMCKQVADVIVACRPSARCDLFRRNIGRRALFGGDGKRTGTLATLAAVSVSLAAFGRGRTQVKSAEVSDLPPPLFQPSEQFGATEPLGFFDPLGFTAVGDERGFRKLQVSEIKHGRVAMMASIGLVGQHFLKLPGFEQSPAGFSVMGRGEGVLGFFGIFLLCGLLELAWREEPGSDREPGNYGDPFGVNMYNDEMRMKELNNGRMAMISVLGIFAAEIATGKDAMQQFGLPALGGQVASSSSASRSSFAGRTSSRVAAQQSILRRAEAVVEDVPPLFQPSEQFGATEPLGFFDPLGFTAVGDERGFRKLQVSEIKHGRVAMMASIGLVGQHFLKLPGFEQSPAGFSVMGRGEGVLGFFGIFLLCGLLELAWREEPGSDREPGNYGDPFGVNMYNDEMRMKELNNGRMAMISVLGIFAAEMATGKDAMQQFGLPALGGQVASSSSASRSSLAGRTSSRVAAQQSILRRAEAVVEDVPPLFQPSEQFGATEPLGFFDPLGFTAVGDERGFRKLQVSEIKHGRVAMMASIGLVGQHFLKLPGFEQSPAGFSVMGRGEGVLGFFGIFLLCGLLELAWREEPGSDREPGNYGDPFGVNMYNDEMRMKELNNGRMAMISVLGIFAAEIATGKDAIQQFGF